MGKVPRWTHQRHVCLRGLQGRSWLQGLHEEPIVFGHHGPPTTSLPSSSSSFSSSSPPCLNRRPLFLLRSRAHVSFLFFAFSRIFCFVFLSTLVVCWVQPISYIETSAKEAVKVEGAFLEVVQMALINSAQQPPEM